MVTSHLFKHAPPKPSPAIWLSAASREGPMMPSSERIPTPLDLEYDADLEACGRAWPRNEAELAAFDGTKPMVARHGGARRTDPPHVAARMVEEQLRALHDKSRKCVLPKSNLVELRPGTFLFKGGVRG